MSQLPNIGRSYETLKKNTIQGTAWGADKIDSTATFIAGMVATMGTDASGNEQLTLCDDTETPVGIFAVHKITTFYAPVVDESVTLDGTTASNLANANVADVIVVGSDGTTVFTVTTDYTISATNGTVTRVSGGSIADGETVTVSYRYRNDSVNGLDETLGSDKATVFLGGGIYETLTYDTGEEIALMDDLRSNADGILSTASGLSGDIVAQVLRVPTSNNSWLRFKLSI